MAIDVHGGSRQRPAWPVVVLVVTGPEEMEEPVGSGKLGV